MFDLVRYEFLKICRNWMTVVACVVVAGLLALGVGSQIRHESTFDWQQGRQLWGLEAIAHERAQTEARAGLLTDERVAADLAKSDAATKALMAVADTDDYYKDATGEAYSNFEELFAAYRDNPGRDVLETVFDYYYDRISLYMIAQDRAGGFQAGLTAARQYLVNESEAFTPAERAYWLERIETAPTLLEFSWQGGWAEIMDVNDLFTWVIFAVCIALSGVFCGEYRGADAVVCATRLGRGKLAAAKVVASWAFATAFFIVCAAIIMVPLLAAYGVEGAGLPIQVAHMGGSLVSCDSLTQGQAVAAVLGLAYLCCLGFGALTLALSARLRSTMPVVVACAVLVVFTVFLLNGNPAMEAVGHLFPLGLLSAYNLFWGFASYDLGVAVLPLATLAVALYALATAAFAPTAVGLWCKHQVR